MSVVDQKGLGAIANRPPLVSVVIPAFNIPHLPIMAPDGLGISDLHTAIVFSPREGELGLMAISRLLDREGLLEQKRLHGPQVPLGEPLI